MDVVGKTLREGRSLRAMSTAFHRLFPVGVCVAVCRTMSCNLQAVLLLRKRKNGLGKGSGSCSAQGGAYIVVSIDINVD